VRHANDRDVWLNLQDRFPHPYTSEDARTWIGACEAQSEPTLHFAIDVDDEAIGGAGLEPCQDVRRRTAEIGYWLGRTFWGRGIATAVVGELVAHAFTSLDVVRLEAAVYEWNPASARVLEKNGFVLEGRLRQSVFKDGRLGASLLYARLRDD